MKNLFVFLLCLALFHACSIFFQGQAKPPSAVKFPSDYSSESSIRLAVISYAKEYIGVKYQYSGSSPNGFDCSGFTSYIYKKVDIPLSRSSIDQATLGKKIPLKEAKSGDLIFFHNTVKGRGKGVVSHVAMIVSNDSNGISVIHSTTSLGVKEENISNSKYWKPKILFARTVIKSEE